MEARFDASKDAVEKLSAAIEAYEAAAPDMKKLFEYYSSADWMRDLEADEAGKLPADLKRGVLSEDGVWDLLNENREALTKAAKLTALAIEKDLL